MSVTLTDTSGVAFTAFPLVESTTYVVRVNNSGASEVTAKMFLEGYDGKPTEDCTNLEGKEIATEGWVSVRKTGDSEWNVIHEPSTYPDSWDDLDDGVFEFAVPASSYQDIDVKIEIPAGAETSGIAHFGIVVMAI